MNCPACGTPLPTGSRFCGVCGHRVEAAPSRPVAQAPRPQVSGVGQAPPARFGTPLPGSTAAGGPATAPAPRPAVSGIPGMPGMRPKPPGDPYIGQSLNGRFRVDSKIGEGGFGSVYRGIQLATGRKVALKLLHPEMTKDDNLVARFRREGLVLCNLRDAHTITTYDFDQTPDGTLYIAMELLEGKSLHQIFHDEAPLDWRRVFKIIAEMCSSLAEAHAQGIVHRDLKPENVYLEHRPGNPEFVKILDFGIAKVMRGEGTMDPQAPQLTATGQTLGTLEYMSPEQLMGKQLDGRSDVYALGVVAYEMITGRLPFPDAKGPAGLITAQLKQTPKFPSQVHATGGIPPGVDRILIKCLEKDKNNRFPDVTQLAAAVSECLAAGGHWGVAVATQPTVSGRKPNAETIRGEPKVVGAPPAMPSAAVRAASPAGASASWVGGSGYSNAAVPPNASSSMSPMPQAPAPVPSSRGPGTEEALAAAKTSLKWVWIVVGIVALGAAVGALLAFTM